MTNRYELYPKKHLLPYDGMSITADVWREAHEYPVQMQHAHQAFLHGVVILQGMDVVASDPASSVIYIMPGVAVDTAGRMIVLPEPLAYDLGDKIEGHLKLFLLHREVKVQSQQDEGANGPAYIQDEFVIVARPDELDVPYVELARIYRKDVKSAIVDAEDPHAPQPNSIDLRFRQPVRVAQQEQVCAGVCYLGEVPEQDYHLGLVHLDSLLSSVSSHRLVVDKEMPLEENIFNYPLIFLVANPAAKLEKKQADLLQNYLQNGGKMLVEFSSAPDETSLNTLFKPAGLKFKNLDHTHPIFSTPHLFIEPPKGSFLKDGITVWSAEDVVLGTNGGYGKVWSGQVSKKDFDRGELRNALEWGANLLDFLL